MLPKINPKQMNRMMRQLGMNVEEIEASEVIIKTKDREIVIKNPSVSKVEIQNQKSYQISGEESIRDIQTPTAEGKAGEELKTEDIKFVASQANVSEEEAKKALQESSGDIALAIMKIAQKKDKPG